MTVDTLRKPVDAIPTGEFRSEFSVGRLTQAEIPAYVAVLREAVQDAPGFTAAEREELLETKTVETYEQKLQHPDAILLAARDSSGNIVGVLDGTLAYYPHAPREYQFMGFVFWTGVTKDQRKKGVATALKTGFEDACRDNGAMHVLTYIKDVNLASRTTNRKMGYHPQSRGHFPPKNNGTYYIKNIMRKR